jgi:hypothetical protein
VSFTVKSRAEIRADLTLIDERLNRWKASLPDELSLSSLPNASCSAFQQEEFLVAFQYYSARILLGRPFLGVESESRETGNDGQLETQDAAANGAHRIVVHLYARATNRYSAAAHTDTQ